MLKSNQTYSILITLYKSQIRTYRSAKPKVKFTKESKILLGCVILFKVFNMGTNPELTRFF